MAKEKRPEIKPEEGYVCEFCNALYFGYHGTLENTLHCAGDCACGWGPVLFPDIYEAEDSAESGVIVKVRISTL